MPNHHIYLLTGPVQGGKTTFITEKIAQFRNRGVSVMGFLCPGSLSEGKRSAFNLVDIETGDQIPMGSEREQKGWVKYRRFFFNPEAFLRGAQWIGESIQKDPDLMVIDEVGPMELEGGGWAETLDLLGNKTHLLQLWVVREQMVRAVVKRWNIPENHHYPIEKFEELKLKWML